ncbi:hypothetical protein EYF80_061361 [Liparis tanakae]|uniref:Uncharacterized protein n=1 Tax=Liparis tanakae TaxID=230148 RepID=A0A4Z2EIP5_9TELE|nr:hypothetical protein EYF80_061361 [Liparis tanakae]
MSWLLPSEPPEPPRHPERDLGIAVVLHLVFSAATCTAVMSTSLGVSVSALRRDVAWLTEELLFRNKDLGFGGVLEEVLHSSLSLLAPHLIIAAVPSRFVFPSQKKTADERRTENLCRLSKIQFPSRRRLRLHYRLSPTFQERPFSRAPSFSRCLASPRLTRPDGHTHLYFGSCRR